MVASELLWYLIVGCSFCLAAKIARIAVALYALVAVAYLAILLIFIDLVLFLILCIVLSVLLYFVCFEIKTLWCDLRPRSVRPLTVPQPWFGWEMVATMSPEADEIFYPVIWCDSDPVDDPLHPHVSFVYMIGVKKYRSYWHRITIWRVSTLSGHREYVDDFLQVTRFRFHKFEHLHVRAFLSKGVIFIHLQRQYGIVVLEHQICQHEQISLLIDDVRFKKRCEIVMNSRSSLRALRYDHPIAILCLRRRPNQDTVDGWQMRFVSVGYCTYEQNLRTWFTNVTIDVVTSENYPKSVFIASREDLIIRPVPRLAQRVVRSSESKYGIRTTHGVYLYNATANRFEKFNNLRNFVDSDAVLLEYFGRTQGFQTYLINACPMVLHGREAVQSVHAPMHQVAIMRTGIRVHTLRMAAAQNLFRTTNAEMVGVTVDQFRDETGVDLSGHLPAKKNRKWWKFW